MNAPTITGDAAQPKQQIAAALPIINPPLRQAIGPDAAASARRAACGKPLRRAG